MQDPRAQLAKTIITGLMPEDDLTCGKETKPSGAHDRPQSEQGQQSMEALTQALLNPCTTVQEAVLDSLMQLNNRRRDA